MRLLGKLYNGNKKRYPIGTISGYANVPPIAETLAWSLKQVERYDEAADVYREVAEYHTQKAYTQTVKFSLPIASMYRLKSLHNRANCLLAGKQFKQAEILFFDVHKQEDKEYGSDGYYVGDSAHGLGASLQGQGEMKKSEKMFRKAYKSRRIVLGNDRELTLKSWRCMNETVSGLRKFMNRLSKNS
ncbi:tetratricopeptide repeat protein [Aspergillus affinis]|uniref:tetratricopeptide repeat protein n=1 Tax=Aspergillus affinis TaxID=1070780 RepID=UPI0022FE216F|nr:uncharacterized protein KD926_007616 [Aspergillus affinis]KAI9040808.1 hypothetical protein KD926_007616 [Aspergillus affinis]